MRCKKGLAPGYEACPARRDRRSNKVKEKPIISCHFQLSETLAIPGHRNLTGGLCHGPKAWLIWLTLEPNEGAEATESICGCSQIWLAWVQLGAAVLGCAGDQVAGSPGGRSGGRRHLFLESSDIWYSISQQERY
jgi:hypothetical protein